MEPPLIVFTDGSCIPQLGKASSATVWPVAEFGDRAFYLDPASPRTSNRAEYFAAIKAGEQADSIDPERRRPLHIYTDSMLLVNSMNKWIETWRRNNWVKADKKPIKNLDLIQILDSQTSKRTTTFIHVKAHTDGTDHHSYWNARVDACARAAVRSDTGMKYKTQA